MHARNKGISVARGEYIMLSDDDDLITPQHVEHIRPETDIVWDGKPFLSRLIRGEKHD